MNNKWKIFAWVIIIVGLVAFFVFRNLNSGIIAANLVVGGAIILCIVETAESLSKSKK
jgi:hypothetical protein